MRSWLARLAVSTVVAGCTATPAVPPDVQGKVGATYDVQVDASTPAFNLATFAYFPNELRVHPGDTVRFTAVDRGEPHTVTFGTLVEDALAAIAKIPKDAPPGPLPSAVLKIPPPFAGQLPSSIDLRQSAMQSCFLASGDPPARDACSKEQQRQPEFTGTSTFYNSGFIPGRAVFSMKLASTVQPGTYSFICLFHAPGMLGKMTVVEAGETVASPNEVKAQATAQLDKLVQILQPVVAQAKAAPPAGAVIAGAGDLAVHDGFVSDFFPKTITVPTGGSVTWQIIGGHTISFNAPSDAVDFVVKATDGSFHLNNKAVFPVSWPGQPLPPFPGIDPAPGAPPPPLPAATTGAPPPPFSGDAGAWDGKGFRSSGVIFQQGPQPPTYTVTFAQPGTYSYKCLIHVDMEGTVKVGP